MKEDKMLESVREISYNLAKMLLEHDLFLSFDPKEREFVFANREDITSKDKDKDEDADIPVISVSLKDINVIISGEKSEKKVRMNQDEQDEGEDNSDE